MKAGGDVVGRDQINLGSRNQAGATIEEFRELVGELRRTIAEARLDPDTADAIDADFKVVEGQLQKPEPKRGLIETKLKGIGEMLKSADQAAGAAKGLIEKGTTIAAKLAALAGGLF